MANAWQPPTERIDRLKKTLLMHMAIIILTHFKQKFIRFQKIPGIDCVKQYELFIFNPRFFLSNYALSLFRAKPILDISKISFINVMTSGRQGTCIIIWKVCQFGILWDQVHRRFGHDSSLLYTKDQNT